MIARCGIFVLTDIPDDKIGEVMAGIRASIPPPQAVDPAQDNTTKSWTVTITYPPCTDGTTPTKTETYSG